jgi:hypothetical protein
MNMHERLKRIPAEELLEVMDTDFDAYQSEEEYEDSVIYLRRAYPNIYKFIERTIVDTLPFESEEQADFFLMGAVYTATSLCRNAEILDFRNDLNNN